MQWWWPFSLLRFVSSQYILSEPVCLVTGIAPTSCVTVDKLINKYKLYRFRRRKIDVVDPLGKTSMYRMIQRYPCRIWLLSPPAPSVYRPPNKQTFIWLFRHNRIFTNCISSVQLYRDSRAQSHIQNSIGHRRCVRIHRFLLIDLIGSDGKLHIRLYHLSKERYSFWSRKITKSFNYRLIAANEISMSDPELTWCDAEKS